MKNLLMRSITGILFVVVLVGAIVWGPMTFAILFALITGLSLWEFSNLMNQHYGANMNRMIVTVAGVYLFFAVFGYCSELTRSDVFIPYLLSIIYLIVSELYLKAKDPLKNWSISLASQLYVALPFALLGVLSFHADPTSSSGIYYEWVYPLSIFIFLWTSDTGAYCVGSLLHRYVPYKLFPRISPNKSWIGSIGGGVLCIVVAIILWHFFPLMNVWQWIGLGLVVCIFGTWGDLAESLIKRQLGVKDSGQILPGHGGMLDRFDSALIAIPAAVLYFYIVSNYLY